MTLAEAAGAMPAVSLIVPAGFDVRSGGGVDTVHKQIVGQGLKIAANYGRTGGRQACGGIARCVERTSVLQGRMASWIRFPAAVTDGGASYAERLVFAVRARPEENPAVEPQTHLVLNALCATTAECDLAERIALSTRFGA